MPAKSRTEELRTLIKQVRDGEFDYNSRESPHTNWNLYDHAQIKEFANYLENLRDLADEADKRIKERTPPKKQGVGRPPTDPADIAKILLLQAYTESPNRVAEGFLHLFREKLGIDKHFSYKTIERGYDREAVNEILDEIVKITNETVEGKEVTYSFDGTGYSASNKENYAAKRQKQNSKKNQKKTKSDCVNENHDCFPIPNTASKKGFSYCVMGVGVQHKLISGMAISPDHSIGETTMFPEVFEQTLQCNPNLMNALGDGIYGCRWITDLVSTNGVTPYFLPRSNVTFRSKGFAGWGDMLYSIWEDPQEWLEHYHMRSISETVNSMVMARFGAHLRKRLDARKVTETRLKNVAHNVRRIGYLEIIDGIIPHWPRKAG